MPEIRRTDLEPVDLGEMGRTLAIFREMFPPGHFVQTIEEFHERVAERAGGRRAEFLTMRCMAMTTTMSEHSDELLAICTTDGRKLTEAAMYAFCTLAPYETRGEDESMIRFKPEEVKDFIFKWRPVRDSNPPRPA